MNNFPIGQHFSRDQKQARNLTILVHIGFVCLLFIPWYVQLESRQDKPNAPEEWIGDQISLRFGKVTLAGGNDTPAPNPGSKNSDQQATVPIQAEVPPQKSERGDRDVATQDNGKVPMPKKKDGDAKKRAEEDARKNFDKEEAAYDKKIGTPVNNGNGTGNDQQGDQDGGLDPKPGIGMGTLIGKIGQRRLSGNETIEGNFGQVGTVIVAIYVDPSGKVVKTHYTLKNSTTSDPVLIKAAIQYANQMKFAAKPEALGDEYGELRVVFKIN